MTPGSSVFGRDYAAAYDDLYHDKDYPAECDLIERVFDTYAAGRVRRVLDLGCGTGGHAVVLAERQYEVVGVDRSPEMLDRARARASSARFELGQIASVDLGETFDAALMMFAGARLPGWQCRRASRPGHGASAPAGRRTLLLRFLVRAGRAGAAAI